MANIIYDHLGKTFFDAVGAHSLIRTESGLHFRIPGKTRKLRTSVIFSGGLRSEDSATTKKVVGLEGADLKGTCMRLLEDSAINEEGMT